MRPGDLPFDTRTMLAGLRAWVECESPTWDAEAVNRMMGLAACDLAVMGAHVEMIAGRMGFGNCVRAHFPHAGEDEAGILVLGHMDTVHPIGTLAQLPWPTRRAIAGSIGFDIAHQSAGGGSDGNFIGALGIATLDGLGALGNGYQTLEEHIQIESLVQQGRLFAGLLATLQ